MAVSLYMLLFSVMSIKGQVAAVEQSPHLVRLKFSMVMEEELLVFVTMKQFVAVQIGLG